MGIGNTDKAQKHKNKKYCNFTISIVNAIFFEIDTICLNMQGA